MIPDILTDTSKRIDRELRTRVAYRDERLQRRLRNVIAMLDAVQQDMTAVRSAHPGNMELRLVKRRRRLLTHIDETPVPSLQEKNAESFIEKTSDPKKAKRAKVSKAAKSNRPWYYLAGVILFLLVLYWSGCFDSSSAGDFRNFDPSAW